MMIHIAERVWKQSLWRMVEGRGIMGAGLLLE